MKAVSKLAALLSLGLLASLAVSAKTPEQLYIATCREGPEVPVPVAVVTPSVEAGYAGALVELTFVVDPSGKPTALAVKSSPNATLAATVVEAVKQWRFSPCSATVCR